VLIAVGAGGVGKTTTAAALAVAAARQGKKVLCLTIDPAQRLAEALGLKSIATEAADVPADRLGGKGKLTVMMLDTKRTFDELVHKYSSTPAKAKKLLDNKLYQYVSTSLAGTQEYMAVEKLVAVKDDPKWDLIVLDTPPTANALDFLDAPERLIEALDSQAMRWFVEAFQKTGKVSLNLLAKSAASVLRGIGKITGGGFLEAMAEFITELNDLFGGFKQRASLVAKTLRGKDVAFVLVTSPNPMSLREVLFFAERLEEHHMPRGAFVVNRFHEPPSAAHVSVEQACASIAKHSLALDGDAPERVVKAHADHAKLASLDAAWLRLLGDHKGVPVVRVPELATDVYDTTVLTTIADLLISGGV
jgi:anion-transporting  ArsA/GET3 family ATPase